MNKEVRLFKNLLRRNSYFLTKPRLRLFILLQKHPALTIHELISLLPLHDQATVYRNIIIFEKLGVITRLRLGWSSKLELSDIFQHHHHHLTCLKCGRVTVLPEDPVIEKEIAKLSRAKGFKPTDHQLEIRGLCQNCR